jgi:hypothetical protein
MICFAVGDSCGGVGVGCQIVKFCGLIVRTLRHNVLLPYSMQTVRPGSTKISSFMFRWILSIHS